MIQHLEHDIKTELENASKVYVAVALMKEYGHDRIVETIPADCECFYVLGVDLPTSPNVLQDLFQKESETHQTRIFSNSENYHPKVYIIEKSNNDLIAFVGSANATKGGWTHNVELNIRINDPIETKKIKSWFWEQFDRSNALTEQFISDYRNVYSRNRSYRSLIRSNNAVIESLETTSTENEEVLPTQFFSESDFIAFDRQFHEDRSIIARERRGEVRAKLIRLHDLMYERFTEFGMMNIYPARRRNDFTSQHFHSARSAPVKSAIWFNYGKKIPRFTNHFRLQIIFINRDVRKIGYWLYGSPHTCHEDRNRLRVRLENDPVFLERLYHSIINLGGSYELCLGSKTLHVHDLEQKETLQIFLLKDSIEEGFIIGRDYHPNDSRLSKENIVENTLNEFSRLYLVYSLLTDANS